MHLTRPKKPREIKSKPSRSRDIHTVAPRERYEVKGLIYHYGIMPIERAKTEATMWFPVENYHIQVISRHIFENKICVRYLR